MPIARHAAFAALQVPRSGPTTDAASLAPSLSLIGSLFAAPPANCVSPPEVTHRSSVPCRPQTPWCGGRMRNAFAPIVRARPFPTFGRPVHLRGSPHRLRPGTSPHALRISPRGEHPALRRIFVFVGQRGLLDPAFGYGAPHPSARGTSTLLNDALLGAHYGFVRLLSYP